MTKLTPRQLVAYSQCLDALCRMAQCFEATAEHKQVALKHALASSSDDLHHCGVPMEPVGLGDCNGFRCGLCGKTVEDLVTAKG